MLCTILPHLSAPLNQFIILCATAACVQMQAVLPISGVFSATVGSRLPFIYCRPTCLQTTACTLRNVQAANVLA